jgi:hypothetical protein
MLAALTVLLAVYLIVPGAASATPVWLEPVDLSTIGQNAAEPAVAVDPQGNTTAIWSRFDGTNNIVQAASRPAGGSWGAVKDLSAPGQNARRQHVAVDAQGNVTAVWGRFDGTNNIIQAASRPAGGGWSAAQDLSAAGQNAQQPDVTVNAAGDAVAVWSRFDGTNNIIQAASRPAGGSWGAAQDLSATGQNAFDPRIAVDRLGNAIAAWARSDGTNSIVQAAVRPAGGSWGAVKDLSASGQNAFDAHVAVDGLGNATVVWRRFDGANYIVQAATLPAGGSWGEVKDLSAAGQSVNKQHVATDAAGDVTAVWERFDGSNTIVQAATLPAGGSWGSPQDLSATGQNANDSFLAIDAQGDVIVTWNRSNGTNTIVQAASRPAGGSWGGPQDLSVTGQNARDARVAVDGQGNAAAVWTRSDGTHEIVQAAGYAAAGPQLNMLLIPAGGSVGTPLAFSVSPLSVWSTVGASSWSFGDGSGAPGTNVTHTYTAPGSYSVTFTSADMLANSSSASATITIAPAPTPASTPASAPAPTPALAAPTITAAHESASTWREGSRLAQISRKKSPVGTTFSFVLNEQARVSFSFNQRVTGRVVGGRCAAKTRKNATRKTCKRTVTVGTLSFSGHAGTNKVVFQGLISRSKRLTSGRYTLEITATNPAGARSAPTSLSFTIVK